MKVFYGFCGDEIYIVVKWNQFNIVQYKDVNQKN